MKGKRGTSPRHRQSLYAPPGGVLRAAAAGAALLFFLTLACYTTGVTERSKQLAARLGQQPADAGAPPTLPPSPARPRLYVDASLSMSGYVTGVPGSRTTFETFLDKMGEYLPGCEAYKFGQNEGHELLSPAGFDRRLHTPGFYDLTYNPNDVLIRQINSEAVPPLSVILTDGVQSDSPGQGNPPVVDAILEWMDRGGTFGVVVLRSDFDGPFYSERLRGWIMNGRRQARLTVSGRPFYAFVLSPTPHEFDELHGKIKRDFPGGSVVLYRNDSAGCEIKPAANARRPYGRSDPGKSRFFWQRFNSDIFEKGAASAELNYEVGCRFDPRYALGELSLSADAGCHLWRGNDFEHAPGPPPAGFACELREGTAEDGAQMAPLRVAVVRDGRGEFSFYRIRINPGVRYLREDISELNTEDDSDPLNSNKTYQISSLLTALTEAHLKTRLADKVSPTLYLTVGNR